MRWFVSLHYLFRMISFVKVSGGLKLNAYINHLNVSTIFLCICHCVCRFQCAKSESGMRLKGVVCNQSCVAINATWNVQSKAFGRLLINGAKYCGNVFRQAAWKPTITQTVFDYLQAKYSPCYWADSRLPTVFWLMDFRFPTVWLVSRVWLHTRGRSLFGRWNLMLRP